MSTIKTTRIKNDVNGNPRRVVHFLEFITAEESARTGDEWMPISQQYALAVRRANAVGGRKFNNKSYGGGIVFQAYSDSEVEQAIAQAIGEANIFGAALAHA